MLNIVDDNVRGASAERMFYDLSSQAFLSFQRQSLIGQLMC